MSIRRASLTTDVHRVTDSYIGLIIKNADNNVNVVNCAMLDNEVGMYVSGGFQQNIQGNVFEGNGGPGVVVFGSRATTMESNYFEVRTLYATLVFEPFSARML